jgi:PKD repeat protein
MADTLQNKIFVTRDEGVTFQARNVSFTPNIIRFQGRTVPRAAEGTLPLHIMGYERETLSLYVSRDLGDSWVYLGSNVSRFSWRVLDEPYEPSTALYYEQNVNDTHALLKTTLDPYASSQELDPQLGPIKINSTVLSREYILVKKYAEWATVPLWVSTYRGPFRQTSFPATTKQDNYAVMDASEHRVFLAVEHMNTTEVHLYISDAGGVNYTLSLDDVVATENWVDEDPSFDIHAVEGLDGTYLVNVYDGMADGERTVKTLVSYNKGGHWQSLAAPAVDSTGSPTLCQPPLCSLHLRMDTDTSLGYSSIRSKRSAVGLILAQGNVGENQVDGTAGLGVFLSRDGGFSWEEVQKGHWTFQLVALGSIIVMAPKRTTVDPLDYIIWSCDEGVTWNRNVFSDTPMRLIGLLTQKGQKARRVTLFGYLRGVSPFAWLIVDLDFTAAVPYQCSYPQDYFEWIPSDGRSDRRCVLGLEKTFERRNSSACCYINPGYQRAISNVACSCSREDYECDVGYWELVPGGPCVGEPFPPPDYCTEGGYYTKPSEYRKLAGDVCIPLLGSPFGPGHTPCPPEAPAGLSLSLQEGSPTVLTTNQPVTFVLSQESGWRGLTSTEYTWNFADGTVITYSGLDSASVQSHRYTSHGLFLVRVTATNSAGQESVSRNIFIGDSAPEGLSISVKGDYSAAGNEITFTLEIENGYATQYEWGFGDGTNVTTAGHREVSVQTHTYVVNGVYTVYAKASNPVGSSFVTVTVHVGEVLPQGLDIKVDGDLSKAGERLTFTLTQDKGLVERTKYRWNFGDDSSEIEGEGLAASAVQTHTYQKEGAYTVRVVASNEGGISAVAIDIQIGGGASRRVSGLSTKEAERNETGLGVGVAFLVLIIVVVVGIVVVILVLFAKKYHDLQGRYQNLQEGSAPMALSISKADFHEDSGYSKETEADDRALISDDGNP